MGTLPDSDTTAASSARDYGDTATASGDNTKASGDGLSEDFAAQLSDAGYTVSTDSGTTKATGPMWEISFHSSMDDTLTVAVMGK